MLARAGERTIEPEDALESNATAVSAHAGLVLDSFPDPTVVLNMRRQILFANGAARHVLAAKAGLAARWGRLRLLDRRAESRLEEFLAQQDKRGSARATYCAFRARRQPSTRDWFVTVTNLLAVGDHVAGSPAFLMHLVSQTHPRRLPGVVLQDLFGLSAGEVDVVQRVILHESTPQIARHLCRSQETVKACLKRIFRKCDVESRVDLIVLLQRVCLLSPTRLRMGGEPDK
jgi:DNA-binding CsgD family transcriptional regulator